MPLYSLVGNTLQPVQPTSFVAQRVLERAHLQAAVREMPSVLGEDLLIISEEFSDWEGARRIDLLAIDHEGALVVIEIKRDEGGAHAELQAIRYAAMVSTMTFERAVETFLQYRIKRANEVAAVIPVLEAVEGEMRAFIDQLDGGADVSSTFGQKVRILLVSQDFSRELTTAVIWLRRKDIDIRCVRLVPYAHEGSVLVHAEQVLPLPEEGDFQVQLARKERNARAAAEAHAATGQGLLEFDLFENGRKVNDQPLNRRRLLGEVVRRLVATGAQTPQSLAEAARSPRLWFKADGAPDSKEVRDQIAQDFPGDRQAVGRFDTGDDQLIRLDGRTYALRNQNSRAILPLLQAIAAEAGLTWRELGRTAESPGSQDGMPI